MSKNYRGQNYFEKMSASIMHTHADSIAVKVGKPAGWDYEQGLILKALEKMYQRTGDAKYFNYIKNARVNTFSKSIFNVTNTFCLSPAL